MTAQPIPEARPVLQSAKPHLEFQWFPVQTIPQLTFVPLFMVAVLQDLTNQPPLIMHRQIDSSTDNP